MNQFRGSWRRSGGEILSLDKANAKSSRRSVERNAASRGATANNKNVKRITVVSGNQSRLLDDSRRNNGFRIVDLAPDEVGRGTPIVAGDGGTREEEDGGSAGSGGEHGAESADASGGHDSVES